MTKSPKAGRKKVLMAFLLLFGPAFLLIFISTRGCEHKFKELADYGVVNDYEVVDESGKIITNQTLDNKVVLVNTLQLTCPDSCALSLWHFDQLIYQKIRKNKNEKNAVVILSFITDGEGNQITDTKQITEMLFDQIEDYDPEVWKVVSGDARAVYDIEHNKQVLLQEGEEYFGGEAYQELMLLIDKRNHLRMVLSGKTEGYVRRMYQHLALLLKEYDKALANEQD